MVCASVRGLREAITTIITNLPSDQITIRLTIITLYSVLRILSGELNGVLDPVTLQISLTRINPSALTKFQLS